MLFNKACPDESGPHAIGRWVTYNSTCEVIRATKTGAFGDALP
jgi:hypothetical protein